jgi:flavin-dependent dehydrogenase
MKKSEVDLLIVGAGPAGLSAAIAAKKHGISRVRVIEREEEAGGVPRHSFHTGYGLRDLHRVMRGPLYAAHYVSKALDAALALQRMCLETEYFL